MQPEAQYLLDIITPLVELPEDIKIEHSVDDRGVLLSINLSKIDMGKIIGKNGDTARAVRRLVRQFGMQNQKHIAVKINEPV